MFEVAGEAAAVVKLYHKGMPAVKAQKVLAMASMPDPSLRRFAAWPQTLLYDAKNVPVGFVMPRIVGQKEIHILYGPKSRKDHFPEATYKFLVHVAANVARAFAYLHSRGCVVGDINHGGILVSPQATATLIDCDSFQITAGPDVFPCVVGVPDFTPPELQGQSLANVVRTPNHDAFGLAVMIFHLLFMGRHPFAGRLKRAGDMPMEQAIKEFRFAFSRLNPNTELCPPPGAPLLDSVTPELASLFERAFSKSGAQAGTRPQATAWVAALDELEHKLAKCAGNGSHLHFNSMAKCPWCSIERATGTILFYVPVGAGVGGIQGFNLQAVWTQIQAIPHPPPPMPLPAENSVTAQPAANVPLPPLAHNFAKYRVPLLWMIGVLAFLLAAPTGTASIWIGIAVGFAFNYYAKESPELKAHAAQVQELQNRVRYAEARWSGIRSRGTAGSPNARFQDRLREVTDMRTQLMRLPQERQEAMARLHRERERAQLEKYLDQHYIRRATIDGIKDGRKATLASNGIETAADVTEAAIRAVAGFGPSLTGKLLDWRRKVEGKFRFDPSQGVDPRDIAALDRTLADKKRRLESSFASAPNELRQLRDQAGNLQAAAQNEALSALHQLAQARADLRAVGG